MQEAYKWLGRKIGGEEGQKIANGVFTTVDLGLGVASAGGAVKLASKVEKIVTELKPGLIKGVFKATSSKASSIARTVKTELGQLAKHYNKQSGTILSSNIAGEMQKVSDTVTGYLKEKLAKTGAISSKDANKTIVDNPFNEKGNLKPNVKYKSGEYQYDYETDEMGRISKFETDNLQLTKRETRLDHNPNTLGKLKGDHAGHLAGDRFGGSPELDNLVSQARNINLSQYKKIENQWAEAIKDKKQVKVDVEVKYDGDSLRPSKFNVHYEIDGEVFTKSLLN